MPEITKLFGELGDVLADKVGPHMEAFLEYIKGLTKEKVVEKLKGMKEAFQNMVSFVKAIAYGMGIIAVATNAWLLALLEIKGLLEIGSKLYNFIANQQAKVLLGQAKEMRLLAESYKAQADKTKSHEEQVELMKKYNEWMEKSTETAEQAGRVVDKVIKKGTPQIAITDAIKGGDIFPGFSKAKESLKKLLEPLKTGLETIDKQANKEKNINTLLESRKKILEGLQKARAKAPTAEFRYTTPAGGEEVVTKEHPAGIPAGQFDKTVAEAKAQNQALDSLTTATEGMLGDLIQNYKDGKIGIDGLASGIAAYASKANSLSSAQTSVLNQVINIVKNLTSKTNALVKTVAAQAQRTKQLEGQLAG